MIPLHEPFLITVTFERKNYVLQGECIYRDHVMEQYKVSTKNSSYLFQCNWPVFRNRGLKHRKPTWELKEGNLKYRNGKLLIVQAIEAYDKLKPG